ncbi:SDR family oxidoreductase [Streptomyces sp. NPDC047061]|uniref:SDR family NAD(P)-dependent oxidoreductase n=1 Tax=Streptomyces sp. NPDC047061 TaxID=3154605 RepID=UPI0033D12808
MSVVSPLHLFDVEGRTVLITGASGALGSAAARALAAAGANVVLAGGNADALELLAGELPKERVATVHRRPDSPADAEAMVARAVEAFGRLDGVLASAGVNKVAPIVDMPVADFETVMDANVRGAWLTCQAVGRQLLAQGEGGSVVLVSSTRGRLGHPAGYSAYSPSKAAVDLLAKSLAAEWGKDGIRVNALAPTVFRSELTAWMYTDDDKGRATRETMLSRIPLGRLAEPDDFSGALVYLLSDASAFLTGQVLYLDGGYTSC